MAERAPRAAVALLWDTRERADGLRDALAAAGAAVVYESSARSLDRDALERAQAEVIVVNLDAQADSDFDDEVYALLDDPRYRVVFNEGDVSSGLSGWDQARWARHLAAKILGADVDPPRPSDAEAVPQRAAAPAPADAVEPFQPEAAAVGDAVASETTAEPASAAAQPSPVAEPAVDPATVSAALDLLADPEWSVDLPPPPEPDRIDAEPPPADDAVEPAETSFDDEAFDELASFDDIVAADPDPAEPAPDDADAAAVELQEFALDESFDLDDSFDLSAPEFADEANASAEVAPGIDELLAGLDLAASPDDGIDTDAAAPAVEVAVPSGEGLMLLELDDEAVAPPPPAPAAPVPAFEASSSLQWSLEEIEGGESPPAAPPTGPADFGIEKLSAVEFLAPPVEEDDAPAPVEESGGLDFELIPLEEAVAPVAVETVVHESRLESASVAGKARVRRVWVLGASIGGPEAMREFLAEFPRSHPALFVLAQHLGDEFVEMMARQLAKATPLIVRMPAHGDRVGHGEILIVPNAQRLLVDAEGVVVLERDTAEQPYSPSIDRVIRDMADRFGAAAGAIVFSGMSTDAIEGCRHLVGKGGRVYAQSPESCVVSSMVDGVIEEGLACFVGSPEELAQKVLSEV